MAKVITTVLKFPDDQTQKILEREDARLMVSFKSRLLIEDDFVLSVCILSHLPRLWVGKRNLIFLFLLYYSLKNESESTVRKFNLGQIWIGALKERIILFNSMYEVDAHMCNMGFPEFGLWMERIEKAFFWYIMLFYRLQFFIILQCSNI